MIVIRIDKNFYIFQYENWYNLLATSSSSSIILYIFVVAREKESKNEIFDGGVSFRVKIEKNIEQQNKV